MTPGGAHDGGRAAAPRRHGAVWTVAGAAAAPVVLVLTVAGLGVALDRTSYDVWGAFWIGPLLLLLTVPVARRVAGPQAQGLARMIMAAAALKVIGGSVARYLMVYEVYGAGDADRYHAAGTELAPLIRAGDYADLGKISGTRFTELLTGHVYALVGPTRLGGFMVFSWLAFLGLCLFLCAFRTAVPTGDHRRYALLVLFFPALVFWPSSIGKEAWMVACLGLTAFGVARVLAGHRRGVAWIGLGMWGAAVVRPHVALVLLVALAAAALVRVVGIRAPEETSSGPRRARAGGLVLVALLVVASGLVVSTAEEFFGLDALDAESADDTRTEVQRRTGQGGSEFGATPAEDPVSFAVAAVTVVFRPFPFEAHSVASLLTSGEGLLLAALGLLSLRRLARLPALSLRAPYVLFALVFTGGFVYAFSVIENFGILARQRTQLLPFLFVFLALGTATRAGDAPTGDGGPVDHDAALDPTVRPAAATPQRPGGRRVRHPGRPVASPTSTASTSSTTGTCQT